MELHDVIITKDGVRSADQRMDDGFEMFQPHSGKSLNMHPLILGNLRCEVGSTVDGDVVTKLNESASYFFVIGFNSTILANNAPSSYECYLHSNTVSSVSCLASPGVSRCKNWCQDS